MRRRTLVALAVAASLVGGAGAAAAHHGDEPWVCVAVGPPVDQGYCQYDPLPESVP